MKIFGIGTDIINIKRINNSIKRGGYNFKKKIFSDKEINYCEKKRIQVLFTLKDLQQKKHLQKRLVLELEKE